MSSSTSRFDTIPKPQAAQWWIGALILAVLLSAVAATVALVDPFNSQAASWRLRYDRVKQFWGQDTALWAAFEIEQDRRESQERAEILLMGDSRVQQWTYSQGTRAATVRGRNVYSLAFGAASLKEQFDAFDHFRERFPSVKTVILGVPFERFLGFDLAKDRTDKAVRYAGFPALYLTDLHEFAKSAQWLATSKPDPSYRAIWRVQRAERFSTTEPACTFGNGPTSQEADTSKRRVQSLTEKAISDVVDTRLRPFVQRLADQGIRTIIYVPPFPPTMVAEMTALDGYKRYHEALRKVARTAYVPYSFTSKVGWIDFAHVCYDAGPQLLDIVMEQNGL